MYLCVVFYGTALFTHALMCPSLKMPRAPAQLFSLRGWSGGLITGSLRDLALGSRSPRGKLAFRFRKGRSGSRFPKTGIRGVNSFVLGRCRKRTAPVRRNCVSACAYLRSRGIAPCAYLRTISYPRYMFYLRCLAVSAKVNHFPSMATVWSQNRALFPPNFREKANR